MTAKRVFVIWTDPLFQESVSLLLKHPDIIRVGATTDYATAHEEIRRLKPDTILIEKTEAGFPANLMEILEAEAREMRIIELTLDNNEMIIFHREHRTIVEASDLLQCVLSC